MDFDDGYVRHHRDYGIFTSPNWPSDYKSLAGKDYGSTGGIDCLMYSFRAAQNQIVQLSFDSLDLQKPPLLDE